VTSMSYAGTKYTSRRTSLRSCPLSAIGLLSVILAAGCALNQQAAEEVSAAYDRHQQNRDYLARQYAAPPPAPPSARPSARPGTSATAPADEGPGPTGANSELYELIILALEQNPRIREAEENARAKAERVPQVTAMPDPMLATKTLPEPVRTAEGDNFFVLGVSQKFPVPGKLHHAGRAAIEEARMAIAEWEQVRLEVIADVKRAWSRIYSIDRAIEITQKNKELLQSLIDTVRIEVAAGRRSQGDVLKAQVELANLDARLIELRRQRISAVALLNRLLARDPGTDVEGPSTLQIHTVDRRLEQLFQHAAENNPQLQRDARRIERNRESLELARLAYWPEFVLGFEWMSMSPREAPTVPDGRGGFRKMSTLSEDGTDNWAITFGLNLPVWFEKNEAGIREARRRLNASLQKFAATRDMIQFEIEDALARVNDQRELAELFKTTIIPQAEQAYEISRTGYVSGQQDFQYVIDNWQRWLTFEIQYHRALGELEGSVADLEKSMGASLIETGTSIELRPESAQEQQ